MGGNRQGRAKDTAEYARAYLGWIWELAARGASGRETLVFLCLTRYGPTGEGHYFRPEEAIAEETGLTPRQVRNAKAGLARKGIIRVARRSCPERATEYDVLIPKTIEPTNDAAPSSTKPQPEPNGTAAGANGAAPSSQWCCSQPESIEEQKNLSIEAEVNPAIAALQRSENKSPWAARLLTRLERRENSSTS